MNNVDDSKFEEDKCFIFNEFGHYENVLSYIRSIQELTKNQNDQENAEEDLTKIFNYYQEQPHLLDPYLDSLISECIKIVNASVEDRKSFHFAFNLLYLMVKTRGYKSVIRRMPHTVDDIEPTLSLLVAQDLDDSETWKTRYVLLLWLSILAMVPFKLESLDSPDRAPIVERVLTQTKIYLSRDARTQEAASFLLARLVTRIDVVQTHLQPTISWCLELLSSVTDTSFGQQRLLCGVLRALANICKIGSRKELLPSAPNLLQAAINLSSKMEKGSLIHRLQTKLVQRIGLLFCPPRATNWQYRRGYRSLEDNLASRLGDKNSSDGENNAKFDAKTQGVNNGIEDEDLELEHADEVAEVIDFLISGLRSQFTVVRWSAAKGLGRMCNRLNSSMVSDVLSAVLRLCTRLEPFTAWHGACLTLAELARRSLLLPSKLPEVIPIILRALLYDERAGDHSYGLNVRDAACYVCWAFARAYQAADFAPYVDQIAKALILVSLFDREVNVRRAASAAFQENVGRQGQFPHGIEIITTCDYFALCNRTYCFLELSVFVAKFGDYTQSMIDHLSNELLGHWDANIRFLAAQALRFLYPYAKDYLSQTVLPQLIRQSTEASLHAKQGNIFGTAELITAMRDTAIAPQLLDGIKAIVPKLSSCTQFRGLSGDLLRKAVCHLIECSAKACLPFHEDPVVEEWRIFLDDCMGHKEAEIRNSAQAAYSAHLSTFIYSADGQLHNAYRDSMFPHIVKQLESSTTEVRLASYLYVLGHVPGVFFSGNVQSIVEKLINHSRITVKTRTWGESRSQALKALVGICANLGPNHPELNDTLIQSIGSVALRSLSDYTWDSRGDIGSHVREVGMECLLNFISWLTTNGLDTSSSFSNLVQESFIGIAQQAVEKIDRTRGIAGHTFASLLYHEPPIRGIPHVETLKTYFPKDECDRMLWRSAQQIFPKFINLLSLPEFRFRMVLGLAASTGGLSEDTVLCSTDALSSYLLAHEADHAFVKGFMQIVEQVFESYSHEERLIVPLFKFMDFLFNNPVITSVMADESPMLFRLTQLVWTESKTSRDVHRLKAAIDVFGGMIQFTGQEQKFAAHLLLHLLGHRYPVIRKAAATKLYECLLVYELIEPEPLTEAISLLTETIWESDLTVVRPVRAHLRQLFNALVQEYDDVSSKQPTGTVSTPIHMNAEAGDAVYD